MSYRFVKRVLGESSLERKIRILFGGSILVLIGVSFLWVNRITEEQIERNTKDKAYALATSYLLKQHIKIKVRETMTTDIALNQMFKDVMQEFDSTAEYSGKPMMLPNTVTRASIVPNVPENEAEYQAVEKLVKESRPFQLQQNFDMARLDDTAKKRAPDSPTAPATEPIPEELGEINALDKRKSEELIVGNEYHFYAPVIFKSRCIYCHNTQFNDPNLESELARKRSQSGGNAKTLDQLTQEEYDAAPSIIFRFTMPYEEVKSATNRSRAILMAVAIVTAFLSMVALYLIIRYIIVKPVRHLRDVTEEVSHGRMDVRAELNTGDEFEQLSKSFNRMLRHLLDTQFALQEVNDDLDRKVDEQAQLNLKLHEMNQLKSEFLANMGHELRTPLNSIIGFSEILEAGKGLNEKQLRFAGNIRKSGRLLLDLFNDILDLAKLEAGKMELNPSEFPVEPLVSQLCDMVRSLAESKSIHLAVKLPPDLPTLFQDQIKVRQILTNLLSNAIKFTPEGGRITVSGKIDRSRDQDQFILMVADTGVGIAESDQEIVFEKFRQGPSALGGDNLTREVSGTGLGLSIVREICILLGGKIELESDVGKGSTFTVTLPVNVKLIPKINTELSQTIDEITKPGRVDFARATKTPQPTEAETVENETAREPTDDSASSVSTQQISPQ